MANEKEEQQLGIFWGNHSISFVETPIEGWLSYHNSFRDSCAVVFDFSPVPHSLYSSYDSVSSCHLAFYGNLIF